MFKKHEIDEHESAEKRGLGLDVEVERERNAEVVGIGEGLAEKSRPLLRHGTNLVLLTQVQYLQVGGNIYRHEGD